MRSNFNFKSLFSRLPNVSIPKEFIFSGIGIVLVVLVGLIASNMHLQEMLFFEGQEKSLQMFTEEELREYGEIYKEMSLDFESEIGYLIEDYANRTNRAGEIIHYGVYNHEHTELNRSKIYPHGNGANVNSADPISEGVPYISNYDDSDNDFPDRHDSSATFIDTNEFKNGVTIKYAKTDGRSDGESNYKDILTVASMMLDQKQSDDSFKNISTDEIKNLKEKVPELIRKLFKISHTYTGETTELYNCEKGCRVLFYYCNEEDSNYKGTGIDLVPFDINPHDDFEDYSSSDFELASPAGECDMCGHNGKGCVIDEKCYHQTEESAASGDDEDDEGGDEEEEIPPHYLGKGRRDKYEDKCSNINEIEDCKHECGEACDGEDGCIHEHTDECYYCICNGHDHWNCPGHFYVCCMGHRDISITVKIMYIDEMVNAIKSGYGS